MILRGAGTLTLGSGVTARFAGAAPGTMTRPIVIAGNVLFNGQNNNNPPANTPGTVNIPTTIDSPISLQGNLSVASNITAGTNVITLNGNISEDSTPRSLTLNGPNGANLLTLVLGGNDTFTGGVTINGNIVQLASASALNATKPNAVSFGAGTIAGLRLNGNSVTLGGLSATGSTAFVEDNSATPVTLTVSDSTMESYPGTIRDGSGSAALSLAKAGPGTLILAAANTYSGTTRVNQGTLSLGLPNALATSSNLILGGGKFDTGGNGQVMGTLQLAANSGIDMNAGASVLQLADSSGVNWTPGTTLSILNWSGTLGAGGGTDQVIVGTTSSGLTSTQLSQIHFQGFNGALIRANGEMVPQTVSTRLLGDFNLDGHVNTGDIPVLVNALKDVNAYKSANSLTNDDVLNIGDLDQSGNVTNADLQGLLDYLKGGHGSTNPVPEPASWLLMGLGIACLVGIKRRKPG